MIWDVCPLLTSVITPIIINGTDQSLDAGRVYSSARPPSTFSIVHLLQYIQWFSELLGQRKLISNVLRNFLCKTKRLHLCWRTVSRPNVLGIVKKKATTKIPWRSHYDLSRPRTVHTVKTEWLTMRLSTLPMGPCTNSVYNVQYMYINVCWIKCTKDIYLQFWYLIYMD